MKTSNKNPGNNYRVFHDFWNKMMGHKSKTTNEIYVYRKVKG